MVVTVGKTNMRNGDLLKYEDLYSSGADNTRIILQQLSSPDDKKIGDDLSIRKHRCTQSALIMGINVNLNDGDNDEIYEVQDRKGKETRTKTITKIQLENQTNRKLSSSVIKLENQLGECLIEDGLNI